MSNNFAAAGAGSGRIEPNGQVWGRPEYQPVDVGIVGVRIEAGSFGSRSSAGLTSIRISSRARCIPRHLCAPSPNDMCGAPPRKMFKSIWIGVPLRIPVRRPQRHRHEAARRNAHAAQLRVLGGQPGHGQQRVLATAAPPRWPAVPGPGRRGPRLAGPGGRAGRTAGCWTSGRWSPPRRAGGRSRKG